MGQPILIGNWKMNGSYAANSALLTSMLPDLQNKRGCQIAVCPPFPYLSQVSQHLVGTAIALGAQDVSEHEAGAHTGEVSVPMLRELGCQYVLVGHSERRMYYGDSDKRVAAKFHAVHAGTLTPVLCVGETLEQREADETEAVIRRQLNAVLDVSGISAFEEAVVAYEPVWAIGTGETASPEQAQEVHRFIRQMLARHSDVIAQDLSVVYGGSVKAANAADLFAQPDIDGGLIGGASLDGVQFGLICDALA